MDCFEGVSASRQSGPSSAKHEGLGSDQRRVLRERSGENRRSGNFLHARVCSPFDKDNAFGFPAGAERSLIGWNYAFNLGDSG
jgi:hypothetical protein